MKPQQLDETTNASHVLGFLAVQRLETSNCLKMVVQESQKRDVAQGSYRRR